MRSAHSSSPLVLVVDDQFEDILWLLDRIEHRGYRSELATNEKEGRACLKACSDGTTTYVAAIVDVMMSIAPLEELAALDAEFFERSQDTGIRLCQYARELDLKIPIACLTVRDDEEVKKAMKELSIPLFNRTPESESKSIEMFLEEHLRPRKR